VTQAIMESALKNGIWAVLFTALLFWVLKDQGKREDLARQENAKREERYQVLLEALSDCFVELKDKIHYSMETFDRRVVHLEDKDKSKAHDHEWRRKGE